MESLRLLLVMYFMDTIILTLNGNHVLTQFCSLMKVSKIGVKLTSVPITDVI